MPEGRDYPWGRSQKNGIWDNADCKNIALAGGGADGFKKRQAGGVVESGEKEQQVARAYQCQQLGEITSFSRRIEDDLVTGYLG